VMRSVLDDRVLTVRYHQPASLTALRSNEPAVEVVGENGELDGSVANEGWAVDE
jgi:hypothetical protein